jgi:regulator of replication initiation timing
VADELEELRREVARLSVEVDVLKAKMRVCIELVARLREELERLKRRARPPSLRECIEAYEMVEAGELEPQ